MFLDRILKNDLKNLSNLVTIKFCFGFLLKNLLPNIGDSVRATKDETTIEKIMLLQFL